MKTRALAAAALALSLTACTSGGDESSATSTSGTPGTATTVTAPGGSAPAETAARTSAPDGTTGASAVSSTPAGASTADPHAGHHMGGSVPAGIKTKADPMFPVGAPVVVEADHMPGMKGAHGTPAGAYDTTTYAVTYTPTDGQAQVVDHKWVVHEEIENAAAQPYKVGDEVVLAADHMTGMKGAEAKITKVTNETVYTVDYTPTDGSAMVMGHMWVVDSELQGAAG